MRPLLLTCLLATAATAQPATVDIDFVDGFFGMMGQPVEFSGAVPDSLRPLLPDGADVLGALVPAGPRSPFISVVVRLEDGPGEAARAFRARGVAGWEMSGAADSRGGFESERYEVELSRGETQAELLFSARPRGPGSLAVLTVHPRQPGDQSDWAARSVRRHMPVLNSPPGSTQQSQGSGGSTDYYVSQASLESDLGLEDVAAHYGGQMAAAGWARVASALEDERATSVWTQTLEDEPITATLDITAGGPSTYALRVLIVGPDD